LVVVVGGFCGDLFVFSVAVGGFCVVVVICSDLRFLAVVRVEVVMVVFGLALPGSSFCDDWCRGEVVVVGCDEVVVDVERLVFL
jgi:hypothetical protein